MAPTTAKKRKPQARAEDSAAFGPIAERFRRAGDLDRAVSLCREGLQKFPDHISARVTLGWALLDLGNFNEARIELELVLRRAPDNLSAIRGLAELHDRSEHTMDLPMDGPGQWPPNPEAIEQLQSAAPVVSAGATAIDDIVDEAVWVPAGDVIGQDGLNGTRRHEQTDPVAGAPAEQGGGMWSAATEVEPEIALTPAVGMSSVREIDPNAGVVSLSAFEEPARVEAALTATDSIAGLEVDLQALIAEAETLEAAADVASIEAGADAVDSADTTLVLDAGVDLSAFEDTTSELTAGLDAVFEPEPLAAFSELDSLVASAGPEALTSPVELTAATQPEALTAAAEPQELIAAAEVAPETLIAAAEVAPEALTAAPIVEALTASAEPEAIAAPIEVEVDAQPELVAAPAEELTAVVDTNPSFELTPWDETMTVYTDEAGADEAMSAESPFDQMTPAFDFETVPAPVAVEVVPFLPVAAAAQVRSPLPGLERFLGQVQRRRVLMAESVA